jgi:hypothetical protein
VHPDPACPFAQDVKNAIWNILLPVGTYILWPFDNFVYFPRFIIPSKICAALCQRATWGTNNNNLGQKLLRQAGLRQVSLDDSSDFVGRDVAEVDPPKQPRSGLGQPLFVL